MTEAYFGPAPTNKEIGVTLQDEDTQSDPIRSEIEVFLKTATTEQRIAIDEFIGILAKDGDSGNMYNTLKTCIDASSIEYIQEVIELIKYTEENSIRVKNL